MPAKQNQNKDKKHASLATKEGSLEFVRSMMDLMRDNFNRDGSLTPVVMILAMRDPKTGERLVDPASVIIALATELTEDFKNSMARNIRRSCRELEAVGVLFASEAWAVACDAKSGSTEEFHKTWRGRYGDHPDRREVIHVNFEHREIGPKTWEADITRESGKDPRAEEFKEMDAIQTTGRLTSFLDWTPRGGRN